MVTVPWQISGQLTASWSSNQLISAQSLPLPASTPGAPLHWRPRVEDKSFIIDHLSHIEFLVPTLRGRLDRFSNAATVLISATLNDSDTGITHSLPDPRIKAGIVIAALDNDSSDLSDFAYEKYRSLRHPSFAKMKTKPLVVMGDQAVSPYLSKRGADWRADSYTHSPGPKDLLVGHGLGAGDCGV